MQPTSEDWQRLFGLIKRARIAKGYPKRAPFSKAIGINDSTMAIMEGARPGPVSDDMLDFVTHQLGWGDGTWRSILANSKPVEAPRIPPTNATPNEVVAYIDTEVLIQELAKRTGVIQPSSEDE